MRNRTSATRAGAQTSFAHAARCSGVCSGGMASAGAATSEWSSAATTYPWLARWVHRYEAAQRCPPAWCEYTTSGYRPGSASASRASAAAGYQNSQGKWVSRALSWASAVWTLTARPPPANG